MASSTSLSVVAITTPSSSLAPAQVAFSKALAALRTKHPNNPNLQALLSNKQTIFDVKKEIDGAKARYESKSGPARKWLSRVAVSVSKFVPLVDAIVPQTSEYASLAWGTVRVLLILFQNQEELIGELAKALDQILEILLQVEIDGDLFDVPEMQRAVQNIYDTIIKLFEGMLAFYEAGRAKHIWHSLTKPYAVRFQSIVDDVSLKAMLLERLASAYSRKESRMMHIKLNRLLEDMTNMHNELRRGHQVLNDQGLLTHRYLRDIQVTDMIQMARSDVFADPLDLLLFRRSLLKRYQRPRRKRDPMDNVWSSPALQDFGSSRASHILFVRGSSRTRFEVNAIGTYITEFLRSEDMPVIWALQSAGQNQPVKTTVHEILQFLAWQALRVNGEKVQSSISEHFNAMRVATSSNDTEWEYVLARALDGLGQVYLVLDLDILQDRDSSALGLLHSLSQVVGSTTTLLKIVILSTFRTPQSQASFPLAQDLIVDQAIGTTRKMDSRLSNRRGYQAGSRRGLLALRSSRGRNDVSQ